MRESSQKGASDREAQRALNTGANPDATFVLTDPLELGDSAANGETVSGTLNGDLTINGVTNPVELQVEARLVDDAVLVTVTTGIVFADYGVAVPTSPMVVSVEDHGTLEAQLWLTR